MSVDAGAQRQHCGSAFARQSIALVIQHVEHVPQVERDIVTARQDLREAGIDEGVSGRRDLHRIAASRVEELPADIIRRTANP